jgi:PAS domain S-box-containing protein
LKQIQIKRFLLVAGLHGGLSLALQAFLLARHSQAALWPAAGISLGLLVIWGRQYWLAVMLGAYICEQAHGGHGFIQSILIGLVAGSAAWMGAWCIERIGRVSLTLPTVRDMALLAVGGLAVAPLWSALGSALVLLPQGSIGTHTLSRIVSWWFTDAIGALAFTPMVVAWHGVRERFPPPSVERTAFFGSALIIIALLMFVHVRFSAAFAVLALSMLPLVVWSAKRFGMRITTALNAAIALSTAIGFATGLGLFAISTQNGPYAAQLFTAWTVVISLIFASSMRERDLVVEQLRDSEARLTSVLNSSQDQIALLSVEDGRVRSLAMGNRALFVGLRAIAPSLRPEDLIGHSGEEVSAHLAESLQTLAPLREAVNEAIRTGRRSQGTHELKTPWGDRVLEATAAPVKHADATTHVVWQSRDVTDRMQAERSLRASEARWRSLIEAAPQFITLVDRDMRLLFINRVAEGFSLEDVIGKSMFDYIEGEAQQAIARENITAVLERGAMRSYELVGMGPNQASRWYECHASPVWDQGRVVAAMLLASDVTDQKQADASRRQLEQQLYQSQKMEALGTLAGGIAHDFNNVLAGIMANAELLKDFVAQDQEASDSIRDILAAGRRARDVVRQILAFSRRQPLERRAVRLSDVILEAMTLLRASLNNAIRLRTTVRGEQVRVFADETQLHQVVMNLATNAAQAIGNSEGEIEFDAASVEVGMNGSRETPAGEGRPHLPAGRYARLTVKDNGPGMDRATLDRIFDPFFTTKPMGQGTGLGLAVVHGIVTSHNGAIVADSEVGRGTTIAIYLPLYVEELHSPAPAVQRATA